MIKGSNITLDTIGGGSLLRFGGFATFTTQATQVAASIAVFVKNNEKIPTHAERQDADRTKQKSQTLWYTPRPYGFGTFAFFANYQL